MACSGFSLPPEVWAFTLKVNTVNKQVTIPAILNFFIMKGMMVRLKIRMWTLFAGGGLGKNYIGRSIILPHNLY